MPQDAKRERRVRAWILLAIGLGASGMAGCAAGRLNVTVDAYKGPLSNHGDTLVAQAVSIAQAARLQLTSIRGSYLTRQEFKAFIPGSEVWAINRLLEMYEDPTPVSASEPVLPATGVSERVAEGVRKIEELLRALDQRSISPDEVDSMARQVSELIAWSLGGTLGARTRAEIDQLAYAWIRNRQQLLNETKQKDELAARKAEENQRRFRHQMIDVLTNAGRFRLFSQQIPMTPAKKRGIDHLIEDWYEKVEARRGRLDPSRQDQIGTEELTARERLLDGFTVLGEAMRALSLVVGGTEFLEKARGGPARVDDPVDLQFMATMDAFGNALLFAADSARQEAGFSRRMDKQPPDASGQAAKTETEWRRARARALDAKRAELEDRLLDSMAAGVEDLGRNLSGDQAEARARSRGMERAIRTAQTMRPPLERLRPAGEYLRAQQPGRILLEAVGESDPNLKQATDKLTLVFDNLYWERVNRIEMAGLAKANYVLYKDDIGNWNIKAYSDDRTLLVKAVFGSIVAAADLALKAASGGSAEVTALLAERIKKLKENSATATVSADTIRRQMAEARTALVKQVLPDEQKPETILLTNEKLKAAITKATAGDAVSQALEEYQRSLTVIRAGVVPTSGGP